MKSIVKTEVEVQVSGPRGGSTQSMAVGDIAILQSDPNAGRIIMRHFMGFVCLDDPQHTWGSNADMKVMIYPRDARVILTRSSR